VLVLSDVHCLTCSNFELILHVGILNYVFWCLSVWITCGF